ncbi:DUF4913 domain-containing protein [Microbacterium aquimaris]|uniref:DUF4913 domain-containing protein n=1 Tax=Microbacterium aquimaris TaxID=459816 RepID=UPI002AD1FAC4|nr:DUF4913 domain-containing protein [Microbacterium aquimaris]MDZ8276524.1 DUF4913 domain-containing protein [Microbacterium aquimaris]
MTYEDDDLDDAAELVDEPQREALYTSVYDFVDDWLLPNYQRKPGPYRWDPNWFDNFEAVERLTALWYAFEAARHDAAPAMAAFWLNTLDPMMRELTSPEGVFWYVRLYGEEGATASPEAFKSNAPPAALGAAQRA